MNFNKQRGFSLAEGLIFLLMACLIMLASMPVITKRHLLPGDRVPHGKWACKIINGSYYQSTAANANQPLPPDDRWKKGCDFPKLPSAVEYVVVKVIGSGGDGSAGDIEVGRSDISKAIFPKNDSAAGKYFVQNESYTVENTGTFKIYFEGSPGREGLLSPNSVDIVIDGVQWGESCPFEKSPGSTSVPQASFFYDLKRNDRLVLRTESDDDRTNKKNNDNPYFCSSKDTAYIDKILRPNGSVAYNVPYTFRDVTQNGYGDYGKNGYTRTLYLVRNGSNKTLLTLKGAGGGYWYSNKENCNINCKYRYQPKFDRQEFSSNPMKAVVNKSDDLKDFQITMGSPAGSRITSKAYTLKAYGGCGGAAGQANTILMLRPDDDGNNFTMKIGEHGGETIEDRATQFNHIIAYGSTGCSPEGTSLTYDGRPGEAAPDLDSSGGSGGYGTVSREDLKPFLPSDVYDLFELLDKSDDFMAYNRISGCMVNSGYYDLKSDYSMLYPMKYYTNTTPAWWCKGKSASLFGTDASGIGAGGGGGGVVFALKTTVEEFLKAEDFSFVNNISFKGRGGEGTSGGIIVSW